MSEGLVQNQGIVFKKTTGHYFVNADGRTVVCSVSTKLRKVLVMPTADRSSVPKQQVQAVEEIDMVDPVAVGDVVRFLDGGNDEGRINEVLPRRTKMTRRAPGKKPLEQVIAANVDQVIGVIAAAQPNPKWRLLDRYLASAEAAEIPAIICITKMDLVHGKKVGKLMKTVEIYRAMGYPVILTSSSDGTGIDEMQQTLKDQVSVLVGMSGVGKSTLLNAIQPDLGLKIGEINKRIDKGRHTTTHLEMFWLEQGGAIIDTPGMKLFSLWDIEPTELSLFFCEMRPYIGTCKFGLSCTHLHEPDCAIQAAVKSGNISQERYDSYAHMFAYITAKEK